MKKVQIFSCAYGSSDIKESESIPVDVDLAPLRAYYERLGAKHLRNYEHFYEYWTAEACEKFFMPKALVKELPIEVFNENFGSKTIRAKDGTKAVLMLVWTIGPGLEHRASDMMDIRGSMMDGLLLDVAGSVSLYSIHKALLSWLEEYAAGKNMYMTGEYYPGISTMRKDLMTKIEEVGNTKDIIGVTSTGPSFLIPRKSQCSFITLGTEKCEMEIRAERCVPCNGKKCLYFQLGGCHMMTEETFKEQ